jgi:orotate phosphoribosyltransferase
MGAGRERDINAQIHEAYWIEAYRKKDALWIHNEDPEQPHALLASGLHSSGFFNSREVIADEEMLDMAAWNLLHLSALMGVNLRLIDGVVGPPTGGTKLAKFLANRISDLADNSCFSASPVKSREGKEKSMVFGNEDLALLTVSWVLLCDDVMTTGGSVALTAEAIQRAGGMVLPFVLVLVNRSGREEVDGRKVVALIDRHMPTWSPEECPLCKAGSKALAAKDNWAALNAVYNQK